MSKLLKERAIELKQELTEIAQCYSHMDDDDAYNLYDRMPETFDDLYSLVEEKIEQQAPCFLCNKINDKYDTEIIVRFEDGEYRDYNPDFCPTCGRELG